VEDEGAISCGECKQKVVWGAWRETPAAHLTGEVGEIRTGHCDCEGKTYLQTRPRPTPPGGQTPMK
jgi:hypothetical protein